MENKEKLLSYDKRIDMIEEIDHLTGPYSKTNFEKLQQADLYGTDLGINFDFNGKTVFLFGDSFNEDKMLGRWNSNFIAICDKVDFDKPIALNHIIVNEEGIIKPFREGAHDDNELYLTKEDAEVTKIPTGAITINGIAYIFYMSVSHWFHGEQDWIVRYNQCVKRADLCEREDVSSVRFTLEDAPYFGQVYPLKDPNSDYIYLYGIHGGRHHGLSCLRVLSHNFLDMNEYEYLVGDNIWVKGNDGLKILKDSPYFISGPKVSEPCVFYNPYLAKYVLIHNFNGAAMYLSDNAYGPFEDKISLIPGEHKPVYGSFTSKNLLDENGKVFYLTASQWEEYNIYLYKVTLK